MLRTQKSDKESYLLSFDVLISRLVRIHWRLLHIHHVKGRYADKYNRDLESAIEDVTSGNIREFCLALLDSRQSQVLWTHPGKIKDSDKRIPESTICIFCSTGPEWTSDDSDMPFK
ncbi:hypothetical protein K469DRAFT_691094 [Zopfia rhizophila CBS 207.26]|uniref:Uncharacterized protein n=1 Tax=Zopfia rhizophila CBS 207.26 TaxID=1314779 RepID=A0A6A6ERX3_9PEZI|nr:hypothetical protein K469DRAFT_691094 [Zopfia rhizophila CBS 207.26]